MLGEVEFQRWAVPCAFQLHHSGKLDDVEYGLLRKTTLEGKAMPREFLEKKFFKACQRIVDYCGGELWDAENIRNYFTKEHNLIIAGEDAPERSKDKCMVHLGEILEICGENALVRYQGSRLLSEEYQGVRQREVRLDYVPKAKVGEKVWIHWGDAVCFVDENK